MRLHVYERPATHGGTLAALLSRLDLVALDEDVCAWTRAPFPVPVRTLNALHLATGDCLRSRGFVVDIATLDVGMQQAAVAMGFGFAALRCRPEDSSPVAAVETRHAVNAFDHPYNTERRAQWREAAQGAAPFLPSSRAPLD